MAAAAAAPATKGRACLTSCLSVPSKRLNLWLLVGREYLDKYSKYANSFIFILFLCRQRGTRSHVRFSSLTCRSAAEESEEAEDALRQGNLAQRQEAAHGLQLGSARQAEAGV